MLLHDQKRTNCSSNKIENMAVGRFDNIGGNLGDLRLFSREGFLSITAKIGRGGGNCTPCTDGPAKGHVLGFFMRKYNYYC